VPAEINERQSRIDSVEINPPPIHCSAPVQGSPIRSFVEAKGFTPSSSASSLLESAQAYTEEEYLFMPNDNVDGAEQQATTASIKRGF
jgi:hypothetical protein